MKKVHKRLISIMLSLALIFSFVPAAFGAQLPQNTDLSQNVMTSKAAMEQAVSRDMLQNAAQALEQHMAQMESATEVYIDPAINVESQAHTTVIVEFNTQPVVVQKHLAKSQMSIFSESEAAEAVRQTQSSFRNELLKHGVKATIEESYEYVFSGVALNIRGVDVPKLAEVSDVFAVYYNTVFQALPADIDPEFAGAQPLMNESAPHIGADLLWDLGYEGAGIKVGILDTGIDYNHPDLSNAYKGGWDFVDNDPDPFEGNAQVTSDHGTHVAGTIGGRGNPETGGVRGVAPMSDLYSYRVLGPSGGTQQWIVAAIEMAVRDGMHVINLSLGNPSNGSDSAHIRALNNAMLDGVVAVVANGNSGPNPGTVGQPATSPLAIGVGATTPPADVLFGNGSASVTDNEYVLRWFAGNPVTDQSVFTTATEIVHVDLAYEDDFVGLDVANKLVLIRRGEIPFVDKLQNAYNAGAIGAIIYNSNGLDGHIQNNLGIAAIPALDMRGDDGRALASALAEAGNNTIDLERTLDVIESIDDMEKDAQKQPQIDYIQPSDPMLDQILPEEPSADQVMNVQSTELEVVLYDANDNPIEGQIEGNDPVEGVEPSPIEGEEPAPIEEDGRVEEDHGDAEQFIDLPQSADPSTFVVTHFYIEREYGDEVASFSSRGPVYDTLDIKPEVSAPGVAINSTITGYLAGGDYSKAYGRKQGTSMAAPHVTGMAALIREARPNYDAFDVKVVLMNTAKKIGAPGQYSLIDMGAGRIQGVEAVTTNVLARVLDIHHITSDPFGPLDPQAQEHYTGIVNFRGTDPGEAVARTKKIELTNQSGAAADYEVSFEWLNASQAGQGVTFNTDVSTIQVSAHGTSSIQVLVDVAANTPAGRYEGFVNLISTGADTNLHVPVVIYVGVDPPTGIYNLRLDTQFYSYPVQPLNNIYFGLHNYMQDVYVLLYDYEIGDFIGLIWGTESGLGAGNWRLGWQGSYVDLATAEVSNAADLDCLCSVDVLAFETAESSEPYWEWVDMFISNQAPVVQFDAQIDEETIDGNSPELQGQLHSIIATYDLAKLYTTASYELTRFGETLAEDSISLQANGEFSMEGSLPHGSILSIHTTDAAGNTGTQVFNVVSNIDAEGRATIIGQDSYLGEQLTVTLGANSIHNLIGAEFDLVYRSDIFELVGLEVNEEFATYAPDSQVAQGVLDQWVDENGAEYTRVKLGATLMGSGHAGASGAVNVLDVHFNSLPYISVIGEYLFDVEQGLYVSVDGNDFISTEVVGSALAVGLSAEPQSISGTIVAEAFTDGQVDYSQSGARVWAVNSITGVSTEGSFNPDGSYVIEGLHYEGEYDLFVTMPGHFSGTETGIFLVAEVDGSGGEYIPVSYEVDFGPLLAGDVAGAIDGGDGQINILDLAFVAYFFGAEAENGRFSEDEQEHAMIAKADINQDGLVDSRDLSYVIANFGQSNSDAPAESISLTLDQILYQLSNVSITEILETLHSLKRGGAI